VFLVYIYIYIYIKLTCDSHTFIRKHVILTCILEPHALKIHVSLRLNKFIPTQFRRKLYHYFSLPIFMGQEREGHGQLTLEE
jgi:hypothetical protein